MRNLSQRFSIPAQSPRRRLAMVAAVVLASAIPALAVDFTWDGGSVTTNNWTDANNWNPLGIPTTASMVTFPTIGATITVTHVGGSVLTANSLVFDSTDNINILDAPGFSTILFLNSGTITRTATSTGTHNLNHTVLLNANATWTINGTGSLNVGAIGENAAGLTLTKNGTGTLGISAAGYTGTTSINAGTVIAAALGSGAVTVANGATLQITGMLNRTLTISGTGVGGAGVLRSISGATGWSGPITLSINSTIGVDSGSMNVSGAITDGASTRTVTKVGGGTLILSNANSYDGATTAAEGILRLDHAGALGVTNVIVSSGASVAPGAGITIVNAAFLNGTGAGGGGALRSPTGAGTWSGNVIMQSNSSLGASSGDELLISGVISGAFSPTKIGPGTVTLSGTNSYNGTMTVSEGILKVRNPNALPTLSGGTVVQTGATLAITEASPGLGINVNKLVSLNGTGAGGSGALRNTLGTNAWSGAVTLQSNSSVAVDVEQLTISGPISGAFDLSKAGPGTLVITNASNSYNNTIINEGLLNITTPNALPAAGTLFVNTGGAVQIQSGVNVNRTLSISGSGISDAGALHSVSGTNIWSGAVSYGGATAIGVDAGELRITGAVTGFGQIQKSSAGKLTLAGANTLVSAEVQGGILSIESSGALPVGSDVTTRPDAAVEVRGGISVPGSALLNGSGIGNTGSLRNVANNNSWSGAITIGSADANIGADAATQLTISGNITDGIDVFPLTKVGAGTLVLSAVNNYDGGTFINGGTLSISANNNLGNTIAPLTANNGGKLLVTANTTSGRTFNLNTGSLQVGAAATLTYTSATVNGGFLRGPGTHAIGTNSIFSGVTALNGTNISQSQPTTLVNFTNAGSLTSSAALTWDGGFNTSAGNITVNNSFNIQGFENDGNISVNSGGAITNTSSPLVSGGGARITINPGGVINAGPSFELNGSLLVNNGTITGTTNINYGALAKGSGVYGAVNVTDGGRFSPGNSPGTVTTGSATWSSGGSYVVEIADALNASGRDLWLIEGQLNLTASSAHPFIVSLSSIDGLIFDSTHDYTWPILHASGGILGFDPSGLTLDTSAFKNNLGFGHFSLESTSTDLAIHFSSVPEPVVLSMAALAVGSVSRRRRLAMIFSGKSR